MQKSSEHQDYELLLQSKSSPVRRKAAKAIGALGLTKLGESLFEAYTQERLDPRTWETQSEMIKALGKIGYRQCVPVVREICQLNKCHDMFTTVAATAYVRLTRIDLNDAKPVLELLEDAAFSVASGCFLALGEDRMVPDEQMMTEILKLARRHTFEKSYGDPRYGLAVACAGWNASGVPQFLEECLSSPDAGVVHAAKKSLAKQYIKCR